MGIFLYKMYSFYENTMAIYNKGRIYTITFLRYFFTGIDW